MTRDFVVKDHTSTFLTYDQKTQNKFQKTETQITCYLCVTRNSSVKQKLSSVNRTIGVGGPDTEARLLAEAAAVPTRAPGDANSRVNCVANHVFILADILVLAGAASASGMTPPTSTRISASLKCVQGHSSPVNMLSCEGCTLAQTVVLVFGESEVLGHPVVGDLPFHTRLFC